MILAIVQKRHKAYRVESKLVFKLLSERESNGRVGRPVPQVILISSHYTLGHGPKLFGGRGESGRGMNSSAVPAESSQNMIALQRYTLTPWLRTTQTYLQIFTHSLQCKYHREVVWRVFICPPTRMFFLRNLCTYCDEILY